MPVVFTVVFTVVITVSAFSFYSFLFEKRDGKRRMMISQFVVVRVGVHQLSVSPNTFHYMLQIRSKLLHGNSTPSLNSSYSSP